MKRFAILFSAMLLAIGAVFVVHAQDTTVDIPTEITDAFAAGETELWISINYEVEEALLEAAKAEAEAYAEAYYEALAATGQYTEAQMEAKKGYCYTAYYCSERRAINTETEIGIAEALGLAEGEYDLDGGIESWMIAKLTEEQLYAAAALPNVNYLNKSVSPEEAEATWSGDDEFPDSDDIPSLDDVYTTEATEPVEDVTDATEPVEEDDLDAVDATYVLIHAAAVGAGRDGILTEEQMVELDVNADGTINALDATYILMYSARRGAGENVTMEDVIG